MIRSPAQIEICKERHEHSRTSLSHARVFLYSTANVAFSYLTGNYLGTWKADLQAPNPSSIIPYTAPCKISNCKPVAFRSESFRLPSFESKQCGVLRNGQEVLRKVQPLSNNRPWFWVVRCACKPTGPCSNAFSHCSSVYDSSS